MCPNGHMEFTKKKRVELNRLRFSQFNFKIKRKKKHYQKNV